jgi:hypothetical protein
LNLVYIRSSAPTRDAPRTKWIPLMKTYEMSGHSNHDKSYNVPNETMTKKHPQTWTCQKSRSSIQLPVQMVAGEPHTYKHITGTLLSTSLKTTWFPLEIQWLMTIWFPSTCCQQVRTSIAEHNLLWQLNTGWKGIN